MRKQINMKVKFDHVGIVVEDLEKSIKFYSDVFGFKQPKTGPYSKILIVDKPRYKVRYAMLTNNGFFIELLEGKEGPWEERLKEKGQGAICEMCFAVDNIEKFHDEIEKQGMTPVDGYGTPLVDKKYVEAPSGSRFIYLRPKETNGTLIEILQRP